MFSRILPFRNIGKSHNSLLTQQKEWFMSTTEKKKEEQDAFKEQKVKEIHALLLKSSSGLTAVQVSEQVKVKDVRLVRGLIRQALALAEKAGLKTQKIKIQGKPTKVYRIQPK